MFVYECEGSTCPRCGAPIGIGLKEEPTGWKVYRICTTDDPPCVDERVGTITRSEVDHADDVVDRATELVRGRSRR